jgi:hypothetical protein
VEMPETGFSNTTAHFLKLSQLKQLARLGAIGW